MGEEKRVREEVRIRAKVRDRGRVRNEVGRTIGKCQSRWTRLGQEEETVCVKLETLSPGPAIFFF